LFQDRAHQKFSLLFSKNLDLITNGLANLVEITGKEIIYFSDDQIRRVKELAEDETVDQINNRYAITVLSNLFGNSPEAVDRLVELEVLYLFSFYLHLPEVILSLSKFSLLSADNRNCLIDSGDVAQIVEKIDLYKIAPPNLQELPHLINNLCIHKFSSDHQFEHVWGLIVAVWKYYHQLKAPPSFVCFPRSPTSLLMIHAGSPSLLIWAFSPK
jgi:hypothetical protein